MRSFCAFAKLPAINNRKAIMAGVNGVEIKVGQVWLCRDGSKVEIVGKDAHSSHPFDGGNGLSYTPAGTVWADSEEDEDDLIELVSEAPVPQADSAALAEETLSALGWTFDGQTWVENAVVTMVPNALDVRIEMLDSPVSAPALLTAAAKHMNDRAATYDKPEGERSMAQTVAVFEAYHGIKLTEAQGWHFMQVLKDVRLFTRDLYHADSAEDCIAYAALKAEAKAQEKPRG